MDLEDCRTLSDYNIQKEQTLYLQILTKTLCSTIASKQLEHDSTLSEYTIQKELTLCMQLMVGTTVILELANLQLEDYHILMHSLREGMQILVKTLADKTSILDDYAMLPQLSLPGGIQIFTKTLTAIYLESTFHLVPRLRGGIHIHALEGMTTTLDAELHSLRGGMQILVKTLTDKTFPAMLRLCGAMQIFVKIMPSKTITLDLETSDATDNIQAKIPNKQGIQTISQRLILASKQFKDDHSTTRPLFQKESIFHLVLSLCGNMPIFDDTLTLGPFSF